jgi:hypothetical protein
MPQALHELRVLRQGRDVHTVKPFLAELDLNDVPLLRDVLTRHIYAATERAGAQRSDAHLYTLEVYDVDRDGKGYGHPKYRWALPVETYL